MKKIFLSILMFLSIRSYSQSITVDEIREIISSKIVVKEYLNSITKYSIKYSKKINKDETIALISIDTLIEKNGSKEVLTTPPFFLISISTKSKKLIYFEETEYTRNFRFLSEITNEKESYLIFYHLSSIGGFIEYFIVNIKNGKWYRTEHIVENYRIDYVSFDLEKEDYIYYNGSTETEKYGKIIMMK